MAKGENFFKRKDGRWEARYIKGHESSGKIRYGFCYGKTYREAKEKVTRARAAVQSGGAAESADSRKRFSFYCDEWFAACRPRVRDSTYVKYEAILRKHIKSRLGNCRPHAVSESRVARFTEELLTEDGLAPKTVRDILIVLRSVLRYAEKRHPGVFPRTEIAYPKAPVHEMRVLTRQEQARLVAYLLHDTDGCKFGVLLALLTGLRIGEICALRWESISLAERTIGVWQTAQRLRDLRAEGDGRTRVTLGAPKSERARRVIPMSEEAAALCRKMQPSQPSAFVLTGTETCMEPRALQYRLGKMTEACGLSGVHFHTLRHTFATRCVEASFELKSLSEVLGHASTTVTLDRYVHASLELKRDNMNKLSITAPQRTAVNASSQPDARRAPDGPIPCRAEQRC